MSLNLGTILETSTRYFPDEPALIHDDRRLSYRETRQWVTSLARHLEELGIEPGHKVCLYMPNRRGFTIAYFAILYAGAVVVPVSTLSVAREITYALEDSESVALVAWKDFAGPAREAFEAAEGCHHLLLLDEAETQPVALVDGPTLEPSPDEAAGPVPTRPDDTAVILYTSGTTGQPKGAELTHFNLYSNAQVSCEKIFWVPGETGQGIGPGDVCLAALPLFHSYCQTCIQNTAILGGAAISYMERFEPVRALELLERDRVTFFAGVPTMYFTLLEVPDREKYDLSHLKYCSSGGAAMPVEVMRRFDEAYGVSILEGYGLSETSPVATFNVLFRPKKAGSIGLPIYGVSVKVFDENDRELPPGEVGEVVIQGPNVMKGYYNRPAATAEACRNGWFHTGDMGRMDEDGYFYIVDRKKDLIIRGGFNVYPREVEEVLYGHPAIAEVAVIGVPSDEYGEEVQACVALKEGQSLEAEALIDYARERLGAHKYPRRVEFFPQLPKGPTGKILKKALRG